MIRIRRAHERGHAEHGWLESFHSFSFADYYDPAHMGFRALRVLNEDRVQAGQGFPPHSHRDMEIISYVLDGALEHRDSLGTGSVIQPGDVQRMSAGTGVQHSEFNHSKQGPVHFLQIWILPKRMGSEPGYEQKNFAPEQKTNQLCLIASPDGRSNSVTVHQDVEVYASLLQPGKSLRYSSRPGRFGWLQVARGELKLGEHALRAGDGVAIAEVDQWEIEAISGAEFLFFDLS